jgi:pyridoxal 5'-phosphate synthase pdxT subunit
MKIAVLAVQGAFIEHEKVLERLGVDYIELRKGEDLEREFDGLILPGGESTVQGKLLKEFHMFQPLMEKIKNGLPVLATCAGLILLAEKLSNDEAIYFATLPITVKRNAYGRQLGSFYTKEEFGTFGKVGMTFIRAPYIEEISSEVKILATVNKRVVGVRYKNQLGVAFHPELNQDTYIHEYFLSMV